MLKISGVAFALALALPVAAEQAKSPPPAVGATREQMVTRFGEPKSQLKAGPREVLFFPHWKLTLRNDVVVDVEELPDDPASKRPASAETSTASSQPARPDQPAPTPVGPDGDPEQPAPAPKAGAAAPTKAGSPDADAPIEIKSIRRPAAGKSARSPASTATPTDSPATKPVAAPSSTSSTAVGTEPSATPSTASASTADPKNAPTSVAAVSISDSAKAGEAKTAAAAPSPETGEVAEPAETAPPKARAVSKLLFRRHRADPGDPQVSVITAETYVIAAITIVGGVAYIFWRRGQRAMELAATSVSRTPFEAAAVDAGAMFTAELLGRLDDGRFERLVASYYAKTGVVAESTRAGSDAAVHIKIFWKGEPKPFAGVQCHARPSGLIPATPLQELFAALSVAEIRRGYVVTTGKFNVEARDFAEEKHFTLLTGDMLLEKLNALPPPARTDLLKETSGEPAHASDRVGA